MSEVLEALERMGKVVIGKNILFSDTFEYVNIKTYILKSQQKAKELEELRGKVEKLTNELYETENEYEKYNEGWKDAIDLFSQKMINLLVGEYDEI